MANLSGCRSCQVIENTQRDLNIALVNELAIIFREMNIDTLDVLQAAGTVELSAVLARASCWPLHWGRSLLSHIQAEQLGYFPQVVLAGRRINDGMGRWVVEQLVLEMARRGMVFAGVKVLVLGLSFKENCPDLRNTRCGPHPSAEATAWSLRWWILGSITRRPSEIWSRGHARSPIGEDYQAVVAALRIISFRQ